MAAPNRPGKRQRLSCTECVKKKRKCDRVQPCSACCFQGAPGGCKYAANFQGLSQAEEIRRLRRKLAALEARLEKQGVEEGNPAERGSASEDVEQDTVGEGKGDGNEGVLPKRRTSSPSTVSPTTRYLPLTLPTALSIPSLTELRPSLSPTLQTALVSSWLYKACPPAASNQHQWIWPVAHASTSSLMLWRALTAASFADRALETGSGELWVESQYHYSVAVRQLRGQLRGAGSGGTKAFGVRCVYTMVVLMVYEIIAWRDSKTWSLHAEGAAAFMQQAEAGLQNEIPHTVFDFFRLMDIVVKTVRREKTYFAAPEWKQDFPKDAQHPVSQLVDVLTRCTVLLEDSVALQAASALSPSSSSTSSSTSNITINEPFDPSPEQIALWARLDSIERDLNRFIEPPALTTTDTTPPASPTDSLRTLTSSPPSSQPLDQLSICMSLAYRLILSRTDTRPWRPSPSTLIHIAAWLARLVVQLCALHDDTTSGLVLVFSLRPAYYTFPEGHPGRLAVGRVLADVAKKFRLPVARYVVGTWPGAELGESGKEVAGWDEGVCGLGGLEDFGVFEGVGAGWGQGGVSEVLGYESGDMSA